MRREKLGESPPLIFSSMIIYENSKSNPTRHSIIIFLEVKRLIWYKIGGFPRTLAFSSAESSLFSDEGVTAKGRRRV
jgi:hypothetical protein